MAILKGFPPSNTISPGTRISDKDLTQPAKPKLGDKNIWVKRRKERVANQPAFTVTWREIRPEVKPDRSKQPRFLCHEE